MRRSVVTKLVVLCLLLQMPVTSLHAAAEPPPVEKQLPSMAQDGHRLSCIHALMKERKIQEWKKAKADYYPGPDSRWARLWGLAGWSLAAILGTKVALQISEEPIRLLSAAAMIPIALFAVDLISGFAHKLLDSILGEKTPLLGEAVRTSRIHHEDPNGITNGKYLDRISEPSPVTAPLLGVAVALASGGVIGPEVGTGLFFLLTFGMHMTYFHQQAHTKKPNWFVRQLQRLGLVFSTADHKEHHQLPYEGYYSLVNGWSDPLAKKLDLWKRIDALYWKYGKQMPGNWIQDPSSIPPEVIAELQADIKAIPNELWAYSLTAYPERVPDELKEPLKIVQARWRRGFIRERQSEYRDFAKTDPEVAQEGWLAEQEEFAWIYGPTPIALDAEVPEVLP